MFRFLRSGKGEVAVYRLMSNIVQITICFFVTCLATPCHQLQIIVQNILGHLGHQGTEILSAASLLSTDIFIYTQFGDTFK